MNAIGFSIGTAHTNGDIPVSTAPGRDPNGVTAPDYTSVAADIATLVADGASPTQGHVNTLNSDWSAFKTVQDAFVAAAQTNTAAATLIFDSSVINTGNKARAVARAIEHYLLSRVPSGT